MRTRAHNSSESPQYPKSVVSFLVGKETLEITCARNLRVGIEELSRFQNRITMFLQSLSLLPMENFCLHKKNKTIQPEK